MDAYGGAAIEAAGLVKTFGKARALDGIDLLVPEASVFAVLGPNGAGKTTMIRVLATLLRPDAGTASVFGHDVVEEADAVRRRVSLTGQISSVDADLTGRENLLLVSRLLGLSRKQAAQRSRELLEAFGLMDAAGRRVATYSGGMRRRLDVAASIVATPALLFLDEPTTGLDPRSRSDVWETVRALVGRGTTVLLTTQYLDEADRLADRIAVIDRGTVIAEGTSEELKASVGGTTLRVRLGDAARRADAEALLARLAPVSDARPLGSDPSVLSVRIADAQVAIRAIAALATALIPVVDFSLQRPALDDVFLALTGRPADAPNEAMSDRKEDAA
jgi:ABC-2 type transport system ATP-binding protein